MSLNHFGPPPVPLQISSPNCHRFYDQKFYYITVVYRIYFTSAAARREKYDGGGAHKFRPARRPKFGWRRRQTFPAGDCGGIRRLRGLALLTQNLILTLTPILTLSLALPYP